MQNGLRSFISKIDIEILFFCTAILLPVFGELLYYYTACNLSIPGFVVFSFLVCLNLLFQVQCCFKVQKFLPNRGCIYALCLIFVSLMYIVPFFALILLIYNRTQDADVAVSIALMYLYAFSLVLGLVFIVCSKFYTKTKKLIFIITVYVFFVSSCIISSVYTGSFKQVITDSAPIERAGYIDCDWDDDIPAKELSAELEKFYAELLDAEPSYKISESLSPVNNVGMLYEINSVSNIKAMIFEGLGFAGQRTKVFAYIGVPKAASSVNKVPAVVLIHGAGSTASYSWVKQWTDRGYAAISVSIFGAFPNDEHALHWNRSLPSEEVETGFTVSPDIDGMNNSTESIDIQWMYHAVGQTILADSILRSFDFIDSDSIGLCGISWGAVVTSVAMTYDTRLAFAISIYGSGYLKDSAGILSICYEDDATNTLWAAENRFSHVRIPVLWICGNNDVFFSAQALSSSYAATRKQNINTQLCLKPDTEHSHSDARSYNEVYAFADSVLNSDKSFPYFLTQPQGRECKAIVENMNGFDEVGASLYYLTSEWSVSDEKFNNTWKTLPLDCTDGVITCKVPDDCVSYYIDYYFNNGKSVYNTSSEYIDLKK